MQKKFCETIYMCVHIYILKKKRKFAKLHSVGYNMSTSTSQEKEHSLAYMQKYENKDVCVNRGIGLTPVPKQVALPSWALPPASSWLRRQGVSSLGTATSATEAPACSEEATVPCAKCQTWLLAVLRGKGVEAACSAPLTSSEVHPAAARQSRLWLTGTCVCFLFTFQHQVCSSGCPKS